MRCIPLAQAGGPSGDGHAVHTPRASWPAHPAAPGCPAPACRPASCPQSWPRSGWPPARTRWATAAEAKALCRWPCGCAHSGVWPKAGPERPGAKPGAADPGRTHRNIRQFHIDARPFGHVVDDWQKGVRGERRRLVGVGVDDLGRGAATCGGGERGGGRRRPGRKARRLAHQLHRAGERFGRAARRRTDCAR
jgi:hypothetical protein